MANERKQTDIPVRNLVTKLYSEGKSFLKVWKVVGRTHSKYTKIHKEISVRCNNTQYNKAKKKILLDADECFIHR